VSAREHGGTVQAPKTHPFSASVRSSGSDIVAAQLPCEAGAARLRPAAEAARPNSTVAASRRLQLGCSLIAAAGVPLFAQPRGTGRAAYMGRWTKPPAAARSAVRALYYLATIPACCSLSIARRTCGAIVCMQTTAAFFCQADGGRDVRSDNVVMVTPGRLRLVTALDPCWFGSSSYSGGCKLVSWLYVGKIYIR
jgi:hypothetical protein